VDKPDKLETLDDLLAQAGHYAEFCMRDSGQMRPALFLTGADGPLMIVAASLDGTEEKDAFATTARLICIAQAATAVVVVLEAWLKFASPGESVDTAEPPSEALDRQEVVILMGESRTGNKQRFLPIIRSGNGKFFGFNESDMPEMDRIDGRFSQILSVETPSVEHRLIAKAMLEIKGIHLDKPGNLVRLSTHRRKKNRF
jgi:hypothetical protein